MTVGSRATSPNSAAVADDYGALRLQMVEDQVFARGVRSDKVLDAMRNVPREQFLPEEFREFAYEDSPLPIAAGQTISQPYIVAFMAEALNLQGGETGWSADTPSITKARRLPVRHRDDRIRDLVADACEPFNSVETAGTAGQQGRGMGTQFARRRCFGN